MVDTYTLEYNQAQAIKDLEELIDKKIPQVEKLSFDRNPQNNQWGVEKYGSTFGIIIEGGHIVGMALHDCGLKKLPDSIGNITSLKVLSLRNNKLTTLPGSFSKLMSLQLLSLWRNNLSNIPEPATSLLALQALWVQYNQISTLPDSIVNLKLLRDLNLGSNNFKSIPVAIGKLTSLQKLMVWENQLTTLPDEICNLVKLQRLGLEDNNLKSLPDSFWRLKSLTKLTTSNNSWEGEWKGIENDTTQHVLEFCRKKAPIAIYIAHSQNDREQSSVADLTKDFKNRKEIQKIYIDKSQNITDCHLILFFATQNSIIDEQCQNELKFAVSHDIPIIPLKSTNIEWKDLSKINLGAEFNISEKLGFELEFGGKLGKEFYETLYDYIKKYKREVNLLEPEEGKIDRQWLNVRIISEKIVDSEDFIRKYEENTVQFMKLASALKNKQVLKKEYLLEIGKLIESN